MSDGNVAVAVAVGVVVLVAVGVRIGVTLDVPVGVGVDMVVGVELTDGAAVGFAPAMWTSSRVLKSSASVYGIGT